MTARAPTDPAIRLDRRLQRDPNTGCWLYDGWTNEHGYGVFNLTPRTKVYAHRFAWEVANGPIEWKAGELEPCVLHRCDTPACCNPAHLFLGSRADNVRDMARKGRSCLGQKNGAAKLSDADVSAIRRLAGSLPQWRIGEIFGVQQSYVSALIRGEKRCVPSQEQA